MKIKKTRKSVEQRFWEKVGPHDDPTKCWLWTAYATKSKSGGRAPYGRFRVGKKKVQAHRLSYEMYYHVTIPEGMTIDHVKARGCTSTLCVNPHHLEVVTLRVNIFRGDGVAVKNAKKMYCAQGHPFDEDNTYQNPTSGKRQCVVCTRVSQHKYYVENNQDVGVPNADKLFCPQGHPYDEVNTYVTPDGSRNCRACGRISAQKARDI